MRRLMWWLALLTLLPIALTVVARAFRFEAGPLVFAVAMMPWVTLLCLVPFVLALLARSLPIALATALISALCAWWLLPLYISEPASDTTLTVATVNAEFGQVDAASVVDMVRAEKIDILAVQELTPEAVAALQGAGLGDELGSSYVRPAAGFEGIGLWSRFPMDADALDGLIANSIQATIVTPDGDIKLFSVHPAAPSSGNHAAWTKDFNRLNFVLSKAIGPTMVLGDFNATRDNAPFRSIEGLGYADAPDQAGAGFIPTFPNGRAPWPLVAIDHAMVRDSQLTANNVKSVTLPGTDHRALVVEYGNSL